LGERELLVMLESGTEPSLNLKREEEIFESVEGGVLPETVRLWINEPCLVRGRARSKRYGWYDETVAEERGVRVLERSTGGGVVYHDLGNLNWSFFLRTSGGFLSPRAVFESVSRYIVEALLRLGLPARFAPPNRIDVNNTKVSGMAARATVHTLLVHGTLLIESDIGMLDKLCIPPPGYPRVSNLSDWKNGICAAEVATSLLEVLKTEGFTLKVVGSLGPIR